MLDKYLNIKLSRILNLAPKSPVIVHMEITKRCNLRCSMCDIWKSKSRNELGTKEWKDIAEQLEKMGVKAVALTGGEPMLRKDVSEIIRAFKEQGMIVHLNTNGTIPDTAKRLRGTGVDSVTVSIDFYGREHDKNRGVKGCFDKAVRTLRELKRAGIKRVGIGTLIMGQNPEHFEKLTKLAEDMEVFISFAGFDIGLIRYQKEQRKRHFQKFIDGIEKINELRRKHKNIMVLPAYMDYMKKQSANPRIIKWCYAGFATCIIRADGDVQPCYIFGAAGNLRKNSFEEIWNSKKMNELRRKTRKGCVGCFANCTIEPSLILSNLKAASQFYRLKWRRVR